MDDTEKDKVLCDSFVCLSTLGDLRKQYDQLAREGYVQLSKARYNLGVNAVGALQYPSTMSPVVGVDARDDGHMSLVTKDDAGDNDNSDVRKRRQSSDKKQLPSESHLSRTDPLYWFSGLPSQSLRMSQQYFKKSIEVIVELANTQAQICQLQKDLQRKN